MYTYKHIYICIYVGAHIYWEVEEIYIHMYVYTHVCTYFSFTSQYVHIHVYIYFLLLLNICVHKRIYCGSQEIIYRDWSSPTWEIILSGFGNSLLFLFYWHFITNGCKMLPNAFARSVVIVCFCSINPLVWWFPSTDFSHTGLVSIITSNPHSSLCATPFMYCCIQVDCCLRADFASAFTRPSVLQVPFLCEASYTAR